MCGICGKVYIDPQKKVSEPEILKMRDTMVKRGPDAAGVFVKGNVGLGHRRLSIIDLEVSHQPMSNEDGTIWLVYNGEVYNFKELKDDLIKKGHKFKTMGDTEVIIHLYEEYGRACVKRLRGMFSFAIWDVNNRTLFLARDRLGIKPLHYFLDNEVFLFGSEIKSILADDYYSSRKDIDICSMHYFFSFLYVPEPQSMFKGIKKLLPGHTLVVKEGKIKTEKYWDVSFEDGPRRSEEYYCERLVELLKEAVRIRLVSDVPLGAFLSGGIDSSSVVALMSQLVEQPIKTFSIGFTEERYDESKHAKVVAEHFKTDHTEFILNPKDVVNTISELLHYFDEPFADASAIPTYYVSKLARERVTVVLSGDGGDELFGGYFWRHKRPRYQLLFNNLPTYIKRKLQYISQFIPAGVKGANYLKQIAVPYERYMLDTKAVYNEQERGSFYSGDLMEFLKNVDLYYYNLKYLSEKNGKSWMNRLMEYDLKVHLPNDILHKVDRMSMFNSLEARVPLLDHKFVEFASKINPTLKINGGISKYIFKKAMEKILPREILYKRKQGFDLPLETWLRTDLKKDVFELIHNGNNHNYFNKKYIEDMLKGFLKGDDSCNYKIWELYVFELWYQRIFRSNTT